MINSNELNNINVQVFGIKYLQILKKVVTDEMYIKTAVYLQFYYAV